MSYNSKCLSRIYMKRYIFQNLPASDISEAHILKADFTFYLRHTNRILVLNNIRFSIHNFHHSAHRIYGIGESA